MVVAFADAVAAGAVFDPGRRGSSASGRRGHGGLASLAVGGDIHSFWANDVRVDFDDPQARIIAPEFVGSSITSPGPPYDRFAAWLADNPHIRFFDSLQRGYVSVDLRPQRMEVAFCAISAQLIRAPR